MADDPWKVFEREVARFFGTERLTGSGGLTTHNKSDSMHPELFIEAKARKTMADFNKYRAQQETMLAALGRKAKKADLKPLVVRLCDVPSYAKGDVLLFDYQYLEAVCDAVLLGQDDAGNLRPCYRTTTITLEEGNLTKARKRKPSALVKLYGNTAKLARLELKIPVCAIKMPRKVGWLLAVAPQYLPDLRRARIQALERAARKAELAEEDILTEATV